MTKITPFEPVRVHESRLTELGKYTEDKFLGMSYSYNVKCQYYRVRIGTWLFQLCGGLYPKLYSERTKKGYLLVSPSISGWRIKVRKNDNSQKSWGEWNV